MAPLTVKLLALAAVGEAATGLFLATYPAVFIRLLMAAELSGAGIALGRLTGFALLALGVACWPRGQTASGKGLALPAMLIYNLLAAVYLLALGFGGALVGILLWPAVAAHAVVLYAGEQQPTGPESQQRGKRGGPASVIASPW